MAAKLGDLLVKSGTIKQSQLDAALKSQLILGGHLGTSLIELGFVDEDTLGAALSKIFGVPYAPAHVFENIREATIRAVPRELAEEYQAIPLDVDTKIVQIALVNAGDLRVVDELSFSVGRRLVPWIAPEVRIFQALETYYGVARRSRYISLGLNLDEALRRNTRGTAKIVKEAPIAAAEPPAAEPKAAVPVDQETQDAAYGYGRSWQEIAAELDKRGSAVPSSEAPKPQAPPAGRPSIESSNSGSPMPLSALAGDYGSAESLDDLARAVLEFSVGRAERMLLMKVRAGRASVWHERGLDLSDETRRQLSFQTNSEPVLLLSAETGHYFGPLPARKEVHFSYRKLGVEAPAELLLIPIRADDHLVAFALADGGSQSPVQGDLEEFLTAFRAFGMSVSLLAMRRKIRMAMGLEAGTAVAPLEPAEAHAG